MWRNKKSTNATNVTRSYIYIYAYKPFPRKEEEGSTHPIHSPQIRTRLFGGRAKKLLPCLKARTEGRSGLFIPNCGT